ncbi:MAG: hypothetical protein IKR05_11705, partial [Prevotella sp.]|nr:hypothetical protein [Prevotella sp.]
HRCGKKTETQRHVMVKRWEWCFGHINGYNEKWQISQLALWQARFVKNCLLTYFFNRTGRIKLYFSEVQPIFGEVKDSAKRVYYKKSPCFYGGAPTVLE